MKRGQGGKDNPERRRLNALVNKVSATVRDQCPSITFYPIEGDDLHWEISNLSVTSGGAMSPRTSGDAAEKEKHMLNRLYDYLWPAATKSGGDRGHPLDYEMDRTIDYSNLTIPSPKKGKRTDRISLPDQFRALKYQEEHIFSYSEDQSIRPPPPYLT